MESGLSVGVQGGAAGEGADGEVEVGLEEGDEGFRLAEVGGEET